eukprot:scaffold7650_cov30-Tisochrysis_lutea.AAC.1
MSPLFAVAVAVVVVVVVLLDSSKKAAKPGAMLLPARLRTGSSSSLSSSSSFSTTSAVSRSGSTPSPRFTLSPPAPPASDTATRFTLRRVQYRLPVSEGVSEGGGRG